MVDHALWDFATELENAETVSEAWHATLRCVQNIGIEQVFYGWGPPKWPDECADMVLRLTTLPEWWLQHYDEQQYRTIDPAIAHCRVSLKITMCGREFAGPELDERQLQLLEESRSIGAHSGVVLPLRLEREHRFGGFCCQTAFSRAEIERWFANFGMGLQLALFYADFRFFELVHATDRQAAHLSDRERECLLWLAKGLRNDRIAERLGISNPTVEMHLAHARRKLGAATREQAVAKAILLGLISP